ncbi:MAG TPA: chemotaxis response regulator protein-glutamate methylesterase, partial [Planctomycetaceae bacterium]|nr:chemotaxis response regulator protein-glutamate methylesterase [Planctomycetaceae bacterium]
RELIAQQRPDVVTLDIEMPRMDGISFLKKLMQHCPIPVVIVSSLSRRGSRLAKEAMQAGAVSIVHKPSAAYSIEGVAEELLLKVKAAARSRVETVRPALDPVDKALAQTTSKVVLIGASTGGTRALETVLSKLPPDAPGIVIVQHMPEHFTKSFADRLNEVCSIKVSEATAGRSVLPGTALIAPGNRHLVLCRSGARYYVDIRDTERVNLHRPSVDVLFRSGAECAGANAVGVIMTGMGKDGAAGLRDLRNAGAHTIAQDEQSCVVFGMPKEAINLGAACEILPLDELADGIMHAVVPDRLCEV